MEFHPLANVFPMMSEEEYAELKADIKQNGLRTPIYLYQGSILDGRNRFKACQELNIVPDFQEYSGDSPLSFVISLNLHRRHLSAGQRAAVALDILPFIEEEAKQRMVDAHTVGVENLPQLGDKSRDIAGKQVGVSGRSVAEVKRIKEEHPEKFEQIKQGDKSINEVVKEIKQEKRAVDIQRQKEDIESGKTVLPSGKFEVVVIDPPWPYGTEYDPESRRVANPYPEMSIEEISNMEIPASDDSIMWLWTTHKFIKESFDLLKAWGFEYKATMVWNKEKIGIGHWLRMQCEFCLLGIKGNPIWDNTTYTDIISEPRREHSRKPESFYEMVGKICVGRKIDYFSREKREGWYQYGNDASKFVE